MGVISVSEGLSMRVFAEGMENLRLIFFFFVNITHPER